MLNAQSFVPVTPDVEAFMSRAGLQAPQASIGPSQQVIAISRSPDEVAQIKLRQDQFLRVMDQFKNSADKSSTASTFNIRCGHYSWASVLSEAHNAAQNYDSKSKGVKNMFTKIGRKFGQQQTLIETFLNILPCGEYTSIVCGGVKLLFAACGRMSQIREDVINALNEAPSHLEQAEALQTIYRGDGKLTKLTDALYLALLNAIEGIIEWFGHTPKDRFSVVLKQDKYGERYQAQIHNVQMSAKMLLDHAEMLDKSATILNQHVTFEILRNVEVMLQQNSHLYDKLAQIYAQNNKHSQQLTHDLQHLSSDIASLKTSQASHQSSVEATLARVLAATEHKFLWEQKASEALQAAELRIRQIEAGNNEYRRLMEVHRLLQPGEILAWLNHAGLESDAHLEDLINSPRMMNESPHLAERITSSRKFLDWLSSDSSQMLFIDPRGSSTVRSPGSFVTAVLAQSLRRRPHAIVLKHFCSEYRDFPSESLVPTLLASLICQLLSARNDWNLAQWSSGETRPNHTFSIQTRDVPYLCSLFKHLVSQVPFGTIFVFIDDFYYLERFAESQDLLYFYRKLEETLSICPTPEAPARMLKVLFMTAKPSLGGDISTEVLPIDMLRLDLPDDDEYGEISSAQMQYRMGIDDDDDNFATGFVDIGMPRF